MKLRIDLIREFLCAIALVPSTVFAHAQIESKATVSNAPTLAVITVNASTDGPAMWRVSKNGHMMWVLGIVQVVPKKLTWQSHNIARVMAHAQELIMPPEADFRVFVLKLLWWKSAIRDASKNPEHVTLVDVLPASMFSRWRMLWKKYGNDSTSIERFNPEYVQRDLYGRFLQKTDLQSNRSVVRKIINIAQKYNVRTVRADYVMHISHPKRFMIASAKSGNDLTCFSATLDFVQHDLDKIGERANAWAIGDIHTLRIARLANRGSCNPRRKLTQKYGAGDVPKRLKAVWLASAESALEKNKVTIAILPMSEVLAKNGYLAALRAQGYKVEPPSAR